MIYFLSGFHNGHLTSDTFSTITYTYVTLDIAGNTANETPAFNLSGM